MRKHLGFLALVALVVLAASACQPAAAPPAGPTATSAPAGAAATPTAAPRVELTFWHGMGGNEPGTQGGTLQELVRRYEKDHPNVTIKLDYTAYTGGALNQKIMAAIAAGSPPDMAQAFENEIAAYWKAGALVPVEDFVKGPDGLSPQSLQDVYEAFLKANTYPQYGNKLISWPFNKSVMMMFYNIPMLKAAGFDKPPATWDEFQKVCDKVTTATVMCYAIQPDASRFAQGVWSRGGQLLAPDFSHILFNSPEGLATFQFEQDLVKKKQAYLSKGYDWQNDFAAERVAMVISTMVSDPFIAKVVKGKFAYRMAPVPYEKDRVTVLYGTDIAIFKTTPAEQKAAWEFTRWLTETEQTAYWATQTGYLPVRKSALNTPTMQDYLKKKPSYQAALDAVAYARVEASIAPYTQIRTYLNDAETKVVTLTATPREALEEAASKADALLKAQ